MDYVSQPILQGQFAPTVRPPSDSMTSAHPRRVRKAAQCRLYPVGGNNVAWAPSYVLLLFQRLRDQLLRFLLNPPEMLYSVKAFGVEFIDVFSAGWMRRS